LRIRSLLLSVINNWPAKILAFTAAVLLFVFNRVNNMQENSLEVVVDVILPKGYVISAPYQDEVSITVKGDDEESVAKVAAADFWVYIDASEFTREGEFSLPVRYTRKGPALQSNVFVDKVEPSEVVVSLEREVTKRVPVKAVFRGAPQDGYALSGYRVLPESVDIKGPRSRVEATGNILTEVIDLSGRMSDFTMKVDLSPQDPFIDVIASREVEFQANIKEIILTEELTGIPIEIINLAENLSWSNPDTTFSISLEGPKLFMDALEPEDIRVAVDAGNIREPGTYTFDLSPSVPPGITVRSFTPEQVSVELVELRQSPQERGEED